MRILLVILVLIAVVIGGGVWFVSNRMDDALRDAVETYAPEFLGTGVQLDSVNLSILDGSGEIRGLVIENPRGFDGAHALRLDRARLVVDTATLTEPVIVVREVVLDGISIIAERSGLKDGNLEAIQRHLQQATGGGATEEAGAGPQVIVQRIDIVNTTATLRATGLGELPVPVPDLHLTDVGTAEGGASPAEIAQQVLGPLLQSVMRSATEVASKQGIDRLRDAVGEKLGDGAGSALERLRGLMPAN